MKKNIYCIEGLWTDNLKDKSTVLPILELLDKGNICDYIYHDSATRDEFFYFTERWTNRKYGDKYPILYIACHGKTEKIYLNHRAFVTLDEIAEVLDEKCEGKVIYFACCSTFNIHGRKIKKFLKRTGAIAAIGYISDVEWIPSTACELLVFEALQNDSFNTKGIGNINKKIFRDYGNLPRIVDLRIVINE